MTDRLKHSLSQVVELKNAEIHAKMLALQAQMNPHFLYNTLAVINIMVAEGETDTVQTACRNLSNILEYISSKELHPVSLRQELQHAQNYMDLMQMRYQGDIVFSVETEEAAMDVMVPKLVIQPLMKTPSNMPRKKTLSGTSASALASRGIFGRLWCGTMEMALTPKICARCGKRCAF